MSTPPPPLVQDIAEELRGIGFTDYEAQAYIALLRDSPATAYQVGKQTGLPRANVYAALENLAKKGAAQPVTENPVRYAPVQPNVLFARLVQDLDAQCRRAADKLARLDRQSSEEHVWTLRGEDAIRAKIEGMIEAATAHVWIKGHEHLLRAHREALHRAAGRGVQVVLILFGDPGAAADYPFGPPSRIFMHEGNGIEVGLGHTLVTVAIDFQEALTANTANGGFGAHTRSLPVVNLAESLIRHEIYVAEIFARFGRQIEAAFGPALLSLRRSYLPPPQAAALSGLLGVRASETSVTKDQTG